MALLKEYKINVFGEEIIFSKAYHKIESLFATNEIIKVRVEVFNNDTKEHVVGYDSFDFDRINHTEPDLIQLSYQLLKELSEYAGAFDVFEEGQPV